MRPKKTGIFPSFAPNTTKFYILRHCINIVIILQKNHITMPKRKKEQKDKKRSTKHYIENVCFCIFVCNYHNSKMHAINTIYVHCRGILVYNHQMVLFFHFHNWYTYLIVTDNVRIIVYVNLLLQQYWYIHIILT